MLNFFKPKLSIDALAERYAFAIQTILTPSMNSDVDAQIETFVVAGACIDTVRLELAAFSAFNTWAGIATAHQQNKLTQVQVDSLLGSFDKRLLHLVHMIELNDVCARYIEGSFYEFVNARMDSYIAIGTASELDHKQIRTSLVDTFCRFVCHGEASGTLQWQVFQNHVFTSEAVYNVIASSKIV